MTPRSHILRAARIGARMHHHHDDRPTVRGSSAPDGMLLDWIGGAGCWHVFYDMPSTEAVVAESVADVLHDNDARYAKSPLGKAERRRALYRRGFPISYVNYLIA